LKQEIQSRDSIKRFNQEIKSRVSIKRFNQNKQIVGCKLIVNEWKLWA
jgi:hypothetical protein